MTEDVAGRADLIRLAEEFALREIAPRVAEYDVNEYLPTDLLQQMSELGFFGGVLPVEYGGNGLDYVTFAGVVEIISQTCNAMACLVSMPSGLVGASIADFGTEDQKQRWLRPLVRWRRRYGASIG